MSTDIIIQFGCVFGDLKLPPIDNSNLYVAVLCRFSLRSAYLFHDLKAGDFVQISRHVEEQDIHELGGGLRKGTYENTGRNYFT